MDEQLNINRLALEAFARTYPDVRAQSRKDPMQSTNYLRLCGYRCSNDTCRESVSAIGLSLAHYGPGGICGRCWNRKKHNNQ